MVTPGLKAGLHALIYTNCFISGSAYRHNVVDFSVLFKSRSLLRVHNCICLRFVKSSPAVSYRAAGAVSRVGAARIGCFLRRFSFFFLFFPADTQDGARLLRNTRVAVVTRTRRPQFRGGRPDFPGGQAARVLAPSSRTQSAQRAPARDSGVFNRSFLPPCRLLSSPCPWPRRSIRLDR